MKWDGKCITKKYIICPRSFVDENGRTDTFTLRYKLSFHDRGLSLKHNYKSAFFVDIHFEQYFFALKE
jgi:hypothetical protein